MKLQLPFTAVHSDSKTRGFMETSCFKAYTLTRFEVPEFAFVKFKEAHKVVVISSCSNVGIMAVALYDKISDRMPLGVYQAAAPRL